MFMTLIRKDFRLQLPVLIAAGLLFVAPALIYFAVEATMSEPSPTDESLRIKLIPLTLGGIGAAVLMIPAFAGVAAARERRERSAEFLEAMPVPRWRIVTSRATVAILCSLLPVVVGTISLIALILTDPGSAKGIAAGPVQSPFPSDFPEVVLVAVVTAVAAGGVAWFVGSLLRSEVLAGAIGIAVPVAVHAATYIAVHRASVEAIYRLGIDRDGPGFYTLAQIAVAIPCLIAGTVIALRRTTP